MAWIVFVVLAALCLGAVAGMIFSRKPAHNALFLVLAFACLGGLFGLLDAPFAAAAQVLVYAGAIMVLFLFAIMMFNLGLSEEPRPGRHIQAVLGSALALILLAELVLAGRRALGGSPVVPPLSPASDAGHLGRLLFSDYLYAFEITSLLILAALVGALALAGRKGDA